MVFLIAHLSALFGFVVGATYYTGIATTNTNVIPYISALWCYIVIYLGLGAALGRLARAFSGDFRPQHARVLTVLLVAMASILPLTLYFFDAVRTAPRRNPLLFITDPITSLYAIAENAPETNRILTILAFAAVAVLVFNLRAMLMGVVDATRDYIPPAPSVPREAPLE